VVDSIGEPVYLLGHSFGGYCALEAALLSRQLRRLILYEGFLLPHYAKSLLPEGFIDRLERLLDAGDREGLLTLFYRENVGMSPEEIEQFKSSPAWPERLAAAQTLPRELRAVERYRIDPQRFKNLQAPTLLLRGGDSPDFEKESADFLKDNLPNSRIAELPGQQHIAMYTAPELFLQAVLAFLTEPERPAQATYPKKTHRPVIVPETGRG
jgi:pimeloyl-ACP methyl ester carboxylesterase